MKILVTICARGGSKGIPGKNIKPLARKPLIVYTIEMAKRFAIKHNAAIALSTDDNNIKQVAATAGLHSEYNRPQKFSIDEAGKIDTINDLLQYEEKKVGYQYDYILDMDVTSPLRTIDDIEQAFQLIVNNKQALTLFSVNPAARNPYFNMVEENGNGFYGLVKKGNDGVVLTRQSAPKVYDLNASFYWYKRTFFDTKLKSPITDKSLVYIMNHTCFDLDHPIDFEFLEYLLLNQKLGFSI